MAGQLNINLHDQNESYFDSHYKTNTKNEFTEMGPGIVLTSGLKEAFHPSLKLRTIDLPSVSEEENILMEEQSSANKGQAWSGYTRKWTRHEEKGWILTIAASIKTARGVTTGKTRTMPADHLFPTWYPCLNLKEKILYAPKWEYTLKERDIKIMRLLLLGWSRKEIAVATHLSVKSVEKILTAYRQGSNSIKDAKSKHRPLEQRCAESGLTAFLLGNPDWFSSKGSWHAY